MLALEVLALLIVVGVLLFRVLHKVPPPDKEKGPEEGP